MRKTKKSFLEILAALRCRMNQTKNWHKTYNQEVSNTEKDKSCVIIPLKAKEKYIKLVWVLTLFFVKLYFWIQLNQIIKLNFLHKLQKAPYS